MQADGKNGLGQMLSKIEEEQNVIKTGPVFFTTDGDLDRINETDSAFAFR